MDVSFRKIEALSEERAEMIQCFCKERAELWRLMIKYAALARKITGNDNDTNLELVSQNQVWRVLVKRGFGNTGSRRIHYIDLMTGELKCTPDTTNTPNPAQDELLPIEDVNNIKLANLEVEKLIAGLRKQILTQGPTPNLEVHRLDIHFQQAKSKLGINKSSPLPRLGEVEDLVF